MHVASEWWLIKRVFPSQNGFDSPVEVLRYEYRQSLPFDIWKCMKAQIR